ncbi:CHAT domain-containing protein [Tolypothrix campylonemoides VB511288]|nr:CHAT domain-containing protein [Tolypothrix campylonemoides VB511288]
MKRYNSIRYYLVLGVVSASLCVLSSPVLAKLPPSSAPPVSSSPQQQGKVLYDAGRYAEAVQVLQQSVQQYRMQGDTLRLAATLSNLSLAYQQLGAWAEAKQAIAQSLNILGYQQQGREREGERERGREGERGKNSSHPTAQVLAQSLDIQGRLQLATGQTQEALTTWQQAQKIYTKAGDANGVVRSHINQAQALRTQGFYRRAEKTLQDVYKILQSQPDSLEKTVGLRSLGDVLQLVGNLKDSQGALQQSLEIAQRLQSPANIGASLFSLGNNARTQQQKQQAIDFYQQTVQISPSPLTKVQAQLNHLDLLIEDQQSAQAQTLIPLIQSQLNTLPASRPAVYARINFAHSLAKLGIEEMKETRESKQTSSSSSLPHSLTPPLPHSLTPSSPPQLLATAVQQARNLADKQAEAYALGSLGGLYEKTGQWSEAQNLTQQALLLAQASNAPEIAYRWEWQLGRLRKAQGDIKGAIAAYDAAVDTLQSLRSDLVAVKQDVQFSFRDTVEPVYRESVELLLQVQQRQPDEKTLEKARQRIEALQLAELDNFFREACLQGEKVLLDKVVDQDNPTAAILYPIILPDELQVIVKIPKQPLRHYSTKISQAEVEKIVGEMRQNLVQPSAIKAFRTQSQQVYNWLIKPIESELQTSGVKTLVFVPDGALRNIPPSALYNGKEYLVEKYAIALSIGLQLQDPKPLVRRQLNALTAGLTQPPPGYSEFAPLPAIKRELNLITQAGVSTTSLLDQQFTKQALESKVNAVSFNILHLATHGQFSSRADKTFILAANGPINVVDFDSILRSRDETKPEAVQLLVLSACQTAAGDNRAALGLAGAAVKAGARSTVASLWQIDDESTAQFIGTFYKQLKNANITKAEALRLAQLQLLKHPNYNTPSFWSAYVLIGNWL